MLRRARCYRCDGRKRASLCCEVHVVLLRLPLYGRVLCKGSRCEASAVAIVSRQQAGAFSSRKATAFCAVSSASRWYRTVCTLTKVSTAYNAGKTMPPVTCYCGCTRLEPSLSTTPRYLEMSQDPPNIAMPGSKQGCHLRSRPRTSSLCISAGSNEGELMREFRGARRTLR